MARGVGRPRMWPILPLALTPPRAAVQTRAVSSRKKFRSQVGEWGLSMPQRWCALPRARLWRAAAVLRASRQGPALMEVATPDAQKLPERASGVQ
eukprot:5013656-Pyramimonas_sp.AAC.1